MTYTARKIQFIVDAIYSFIEAKDSTEADIRRTVITYLNIDPEFFTDAELDGFETAIQNAFHPDANQSNNN